MPMPVNEYVSPPRYAFRQTLSPSFETINGRGCVDSLCPISSLAADEILQEQFSLPCGLTFSFSNFTAPRPLAVTFTDFKASLGFSFYLAGGFTVTWGRGKQTRIDSGQSASFSFPGMDSCQETMEPERLCRVVVSLAKDRYGTFAESYPEIVSAGLFPNSDGKITIHSNAIGDAYKPVISQILHCGYTGATRRFFLEAKLMELLALKMQELSGQSHNTSGSYPPNRREQEKARHVAYLLTLDLSDNPDMHALAKTVGLSRTKLHEVFHNVYALTPYAYLRKCRLEKARAMLREGGANVTEAAYAVGYSSLSHFSKAFASEFGGLPKEFIKKGI